MLVRASLGMAAAMALIGMAHNIWQLAGLRLLTGMLGGYASGSLALVAAQTPKTRTGWALGMMTSAIMAGSLAGPLLGGVLPMHMGIRKTFFLAGAVIFVAFLATVFLLREERQPATPRPSEGKAADKAGWSAVPHKRPVIVMLATSGLLYFALMSIEPIITVYVGQLVANQAHVTWVAGVVIAATALGSMLSSARLGRLADRVGHWRILALCLVIAALLVLPQAFVTASWQLVVLRFLMGLALGGLMPCITSVIRHSVPQRVIGSVLGYSFSAQSLGQVVGPLLGGFIGGHLGIRPVFFVTSALLALGAAWNWRELSRRARD
jgi:MFS family permease